MGNRFPGTRPPPGVGELGWLGAGRGLGVGGGVRFWRRVDAVGGNAGDGAISDHGVAGAAAGTMAGRDRSARNAGILVLVAPDGTPECGGGLSDVLEHGGGKSLDDAVAGDSFAG